LIANHRHYILLPTERSLRYDVYLLANSRLGKQDRICYEVLHSGLFTLIANIFLHVTFILKESVDEARLLLGASGDNKSFECCFKREASESCALIKELVDDARDLVGVPGHSRSGCFRAGCPEGEIFELPELRLLTFWSAFDHRALALHLDTILATVSALLAMIFRSSKKNTPESLSPISVDFCGVRMSIPSIRR
jgi:hypothetical protein